MPRPFEDDRPPSSLLRIRDTISVAIAPIVGEPVAVTTKLGDAMAKALLKRDVAASEKTVSLGGYQLFGRVLPPPRSAPMREGDKAERTLKVMWRLYAANKKTLGERTVTLRAKAGDWASGSDAAIERLAAASAEEIAPILIEEGPKETAVEADSARVRIAVGKISGAPGDGSKSLTDALSAVLKRQDLTVVGNEDKPDLRIEGEIAVDPAKGNKQHVKILWRVRRADGAEIGTIGQENDVPRGTLDGPWGDLAYSVVLAAGDGLMQVIARGAPEPAGATPARQADAAPGR